MPPPSLFFLVPDVEDDDDVNWSSMRTNVGAEREGGVRPRISTLPWRFTWTCDFAPDVDGAAENIGAAEAEAAGVADIAPSICESAARCWLLRSVLRIEASVSATLLLAAIEAAVVEEEEEDDVSDCTKLANCISELLSCCRSCCCAPRMSTEPWRFTLTADAAGEEPWPCDSDWYVRDAGAVV